MAKAKKSEAVELKETLTKLRKNLNVDPINTAIEKFLALNGKLDDISKYYVRLILKYILKIDIDTERARQIAYEIQDVVVGLERYLDIKGRDEHPKRYGLSVSEEPTKDE